MTKTYYIIFVCVSMFTHICCFAQNEDEQRKLSHTRTEFLDSINNEQFRYLLISYLESFYKRYNRYPDDKQFLFKDLVRFSDGPYLYLEHLIGSQQKDINIITENDVLSIDIDTIPLIRFKGKREDPPDTYTFNFELFRYNFRIIESIYHFDIEPIKFEQTLYSPPVDYYGQLNKAFYSFFDVEGLYIFDKFELTNNLRELEEELQFKLWPESEWDRMFEAIDCKRCVTYQLAQWTRNSGLTLLDSNETIPRVIRDAIDKMLQKADSVNRAIIPIPIRAKSMSDIYELKGFIQECRTNDARLLMLLSQYRIKEKYCDHILDENILQIEFNKIDSVAFADYKDNIDRYKMVKDNDRNLHVYYDGIEILVSKPYVPTGEEVTASNYYVKMYDSSGLYVGTDTSSELLQSLLSMYTSSGYELTQNTFTDGQYYDDYSYSLVRLDVDNGECCVIYGTAPEPTLVDKALPIAKQFCTKHGIKSIVFPLLNGKSCDFSEQ